MSVRWEGLLGLLVLVFIVALLSSPLVARSDTAPLRIEVNNGGIQLEAPPGSLTEAQREALMQWLNRHIEDSPFFEYGGGVRLQLGEEKLQKLRPALDRLAKGDDDAIEDVFEDLIEEQDRGKGSERVIIGNDFRIEAGEALDELVAIGSRGTIAGRVKTVVALGSQITVERTGEITEKLVSVGSRLERLPGSTVTSEEVSIQLPGTTAFWQGLAENWRSSDWNQFGWVSSLANSLGSLVLGILYLILFPAFALKNHRYLEENWVSSLAYGLLGAVGVIPGVVLLILTILGIFLVPLYLLFVLLLWTLGMVEVSACIGSRLLGQRSPHLLVTFLAGFVLLQAVSWIPLLGYPLLLFANLSGFGSVLVGLFHRWRPA